MPYMMETRVTIVAIILMTPFANPIPQAKVQYQVSK